MARKIGNLTVNITANSSRFNRGIRQSQTQMKRFRKSVIDTGRALKGALVFSAIRGIGRQLKAFNAFAALLSH